MGLRREVRRRRRESHPQLLRRRVALARSSETKYYQWNREQNENFISSDLSLYDPSIFSFSAPLLLLLALYLRFGAASSRSHYCVESPSSAFISIDLFKLRSSRTHSYTFQYSFLVRLAKASVKMTQPDESFITRVRGRENGERATEDGESEKSGHERKNTRAASFSATHLSRRKKAAANSSRVKVEKSTTIN